MEVKDSLYADPKQTGDRKPRPHRHPSPPPPVPLMARKMEKFHSPGKGNGLRATSTVSPGELLYVAEPFAYTVNNVGRGLVCEHCLRKTDKLLQCSRCKFAKYCGKRCQTEAWPDHKRECKCLKSVSFKEATEPIRLVGKIMLKVIRQSSPCPSEELYSASELESNFENIREDYKKEFEFFAEMLLPYLKVKIPLLSLLMTDSILPECFAKVSCNRFSIHTWDLVNVADGLYPSLSLLNHSCEPNCTVVSKGRQLQLRAITEIHIGEELTMAYIDPLMPTAERQEVLRGTYCFDCDCRRCLTRDKDEHMLAGDKQASEDTKDLISNVTELQAQNQWEESLALCRAQLKSNEGLVPDENIYQLALLDYAMEACVQLNMSEEALQYGSRTLEPYRMYNSGIKPMRCLPVMKLGMLQFNEGKLPEALKTLNEAFDIMKICYGTDHPMTQHVTHVLLSCKIRQRLNL